MKIYVDKITNQVAMHSDTALTVDTNRFNEFTISPSAEELTHFANNDKAHYIGAELSFVEHSVSKNTTAFEALKTELNGNDLPNSQMRRIMRDIIDLVKVV